MDCLINSAWIELNRIFSFPTIKYIAHLFLFEEDLGPNQISKTKLKGPRTLPCGTPHAHVLWVWDTYTTSFSCGPCGCALCVSREVFPQHKHCWSRRQLLYVTLFFYFSPCSMFLQSRISKSAIWSFCSFPVFFSALYLLHYIILLFFLFPILFSPSVYSLYFQISLIVFFWNLLSFLFSFPITLFCLLLFHLFSFY